MRRTWTACLEKTERRTSIAGDLSPLATVHKGDFQAIRVLPSPRPAQSEPVGGVRPAGACVLGSGARPPAACGACLAGCGGVERLLQGVIGGAP
jgi:hypothetical protein